MFTFQFPAPIRSRSSFDLKFYGYLLKCTTRIMSSVVNYPWSYIYVNGPDKPLYFRRVNSGQNETESTISDCSVTVKSNSKVLNTDYSKYLLLSNASFNKDGYVCSAIKSHLAYRENGLWPFTLFSHAVLFNQELAAELEETDRLSRGVFCCCISAEHHSQVHTEILEFLKRYSNFLAYKIHETPCKHLFKMILIGNDDESSVADNTEIDLQLVDRVAVKDLQGYDSVASPIFSVPVISPVFHNYSEALGILEKLSDVPEVKDLLDISGRYAAVLTQKSCDQALLHPFVVVEGMDATGKTTLTELLEKRMGAARYFTPPPRITQLRAFFDKYPEIVRRAYYSMGNYIVAGEIIKECQNRPVIMDRFWHSTAAYGIANETSSGDLPESDHPVYRWPSDLLKPTIVLFLTVSEDVRKQRLSGRGVQATFEERSLDNDQLFRQRLCDAYRRMNKPCCIEIDAGGTVEEVQNKALQVLQSYGVNLDRSE